MLHTLPVVMTAPSLLQGTQRTDVIIVTTLITMTTMMILTVRRHQQILKVHDMNFRYLVSKQRHCRHQVNLKIMNLVHDTHGLARLSVMSIPFCFLFTK